MTIRVTVWGENVHEQENAVVAGIYPKGMHTTIADALNRDSNITASTVVMQDTDHGITPEQLAETDVLIWWGHKAHGEVSDAVVERVANAVWSGMGVIFLHSAHFSKPFKRLMGTPCNLSWREAGERERLWLTSRNHPIAAGLPDHFELENEEMYGEPFDIPSPTSWSSCRGIPAARSSARAAPSSAGGGGSSSSARGTRPSRSTTCPRFTA